MCMLRPLRRRRWSSRSLQKLITGDRSGGKTWQSFCRNEPDGKHIPLFLFFRIDEIGIIIVNKTARCMFVLGHPEAPFDGLERRGLHCHVLLSGDPDLSKISVLVHHFHTPITFSCPEVFVMVGVVAQDSLPRVELGDSDVHRLKLFK